MWRDPPYVGSHHLLSQLKTQFDKIVDELTINNQKTLQKSTPSVNNIVDDKTLRLTYLKRVLVGTGMVYLSGIDPNAAGDKSERLNIASIYTALLTQSSEETDHKTIEKQTKRLSALSMLNNHKHLVLLGTMGTSMI